MRLDEINFRDAVVALHCEACDGTGEYRCADGADWCGECSGFGVVPVYIGTWLANLAVAAGLCMAFAQGEYFERDTAIGGWRLAERWAPGCQRPASGWETP